MYQSTNAVFTRPVLRKTPVWNNAGEWTVKAGCHQVHSSGPLLDGRCARCQGRTYSFLPAANVLVRRGKAARIHRGEFLTGLLRLYNEAHLSSGHDRVEMAEEDIRINGVLCL